MTRLVDDLCRMRMLLAGVYLGMGISSIYSFSLITEYLKEKYGFSQSDITTISTVANCVGYCSFFVGMLFDYAGPMVVLSLAGVFGFLGFLFVGMTFGDIISVSNVPLFSFYYGLAYIAAPAMDIGSIIPLMLQFPLERGYVIIIPKTLGGLGTSVLVAYFNGWFKAANSSNVKNNNYSGFLYFLSAQVLLCCFVGAYLTRLPMYFPCAWRKKRLSPTELAERGGTLALYMKQHAPMRRLRIGILLIVVLLIFSTTQSIVTAYTKTSHEGYLVISIFALLLMASFSVMALPFQFLGRYTPVKPTHMDVIGEADIQGSGEPGAVTLFEGPGSDDANTELTEATRPAPQYEGSFWSHLLTVDLWALWFTCFGVWGTGIVMLMNAAQIYSSKNYGKGETPTLTLYVAIMSVGSAFGRILMGFLDVKLTEWQRAGKTNVLTTIALPLGPILLVLAYLFFAVLPQQALVLPFFLGAMGYGVGWGVGPLAVRMMYAQDIGKHYNFCFSSGVVSTIALNRFMFGELYDSEARRLGKFPLCEDPSCVRTQMFILMAVNVLSTFSGFLVQWRFARYTREKLEEHRSPASLSKDQVA